MKIQLIFLMNKQRDIKGQQSKNEGCVQDDEPLIVEEILEQQRKSKGNKIKYCYAIGVISLILAFLYYLQERLTQKLETLNSNAQFIKMPEKPRNYTVEQLNERIKQMQKRSQNPIAQPTFKFKPTPQAYFAYSLYQNPSQINLQAQYLYYQQKYQIGSPSFSKQQPICIVSAGRNLAFQQKHYKFLASIARLNYTNYRLIIIDDASDDNTVQQIHQFVNNKSKNETDFRRLRERMKVIENQQRMYALWNRNKAIREYCQNEDIVVEIDPDDSFIGRQPLKYINSVYTNSSVWVFYSNYVYFSVQNGEPTGGISQKIPSNLLKNNLYRTSDKWVTSATRTFRQKLYMKIDQTDFIDRNFPEYLPDGTINQDKYYKWCADLFMHYSLIQLAGQQHYSYSQQIFYYYSLIHNPYQALHKKLDKFTSYLITPYKPLLSLDEQPQRIQNTGLKQYKPPAWLQEEWQKIKKEVDQNKS